MAVLTAQERRGGLLSLRVTSRHSPSCSVVSPGYDGYDGCDGYDGHDSYDSYDGRAAFSGRRSARAAAPLALARSHTHTHAHPHTHTHPPFSRRRRRNAMVGAARCARSSRLVALVKADASVCNGVAPHPHRAVPLLATCVRYDRYDRHNRRNVAVPPLATRAYVRTCGRAALASPRLASEGPRP